MQLIEEFKQIGSEQDLREFLEQHGFRLGDSRSHPDAHVLGLFTGRHDGRALKIIHRLVSEPSSSTGTANKHRLLLEIEQAQAVEISFDATY